jgi:fibronectin-binding autotransporter adhesin
VQVNKVNIAGSYTVDSGTVAGITNPGNIDFNGSSASAIITLTTTPTITVISPTNTASGFMIFNGTVTEDSSPRGIIKDGSGVLTLNNANNSYTGNTTILNGQLRIDGDGKLGTGAGTLFLSGGKLNISASRTPSSDPVSNPIVVTADSSITTTSGAANVDLNLSNDSVSGTGGTLTFRNEAAAGNGVFQPRFSGSGFNFTRPIDLAAGLNGATRSTELNSYNTTGTTQTFSGVISGDGSYVRNASTAGSGGTTVFTAANTYSGGTSVSRGTLLANNTSGSGTGSGAVTVGGNGILGGTGSIDGLVTVNNFGIVAPGAGLGTLTLAGGLTLQGGSSLSMELGAPSSGDRINVTLADGLTINTDVTNGNVKVTLLDAGGLAAGSYTLVDYVGALGGAFSNLELAMTQPAGFTYQLVDNASNTSIDLLVTGATGGVLGDYNGNGVVDGADYVIWRKNNGLMGGATASQGDGTGDGNVDSADFTFWRERFGNTSGSGSGIMSGDAVPEPAAHLLLIACLAITCTSGRR